MWAQFAHHIILIWVCAVQVICGPISRFRYRTGNSLFPSHCGPVGYLSLLVVVSGIECAILFDSHFLLWFQSHLFLLVVEVCSDILWMSSGTINTPLQASTKIEHSGSHLFMMTSWVVFRMVISNFYSCSWFPKNFELSLGLSISDPVVSHVHGLSHFVFDSFVCYPYSCCIITYDVGLTLGMSHFF